MKTILAIAALLSITTVTLYLQNDNLNLQSIQDIDASDFAIYQAWKIQHGKDGSEDAYRFPIFQEYLRFVEKHNNSGDTFTVGLNQFSDLTQQEFQDRYLMKRDKGPAPIRKVVKDYKINPNAGSIDWIEKGAVTPVKNQGNCGSCWAFSATAGLEGAYEIDTGNLVNLSEQQITSCTPLPSEGCNGGYSYNGYDYASTHGVETDESYPYVQESDPNTASCQYNKSKTVWSNKGVASLPANNPAAMLSQLQIQPLSVAIDATSNYFRGYTGGILSTTFLCGNYLDHAVTIVGYDETQDYWLIKNSWGNWWGDQGYVKIAKTEGSGVCGVNMQVDYPTF